MQAGSARLAAELAVNSLTQASTPRPDQSQQQLSWP